MRKTHPFPYPSGRKFWFFFTSLLGVCLCFIQNDFCVPLTHTHTVLYRPRKKHHPCFKIQRLLYCMNISTHIHTHTQLESIWPFAVQPRATAQPTAIKCGKKEWRSFRSSVYSIIVCISWVLFEKNIPFLFQHYFIQALLFI